jgi:anaerobic selenocysteine-containing dehydrogenase
MIRRPCCLRPCAPHDKYNTTIYTLSDRYRGVFGQRDIVFINRREMEKRALKAQNRVDLVTLSTDGMERGVRGFKAVPYALSGGCCGARYPETNPLVPLYARDPHSFTPASKSVPVRLIRSGEGENKKRP